MCKAVCIAETTRTILIRLIQTQSCHLGALGVRRAVGAKEEAGVAADGGAKHRLPVPLALQDRQAERVRPHAALQRGTSVSGPLSHAGHLILIRQAGCTPC